MSTLPGADGRPRCQWCTGAPAYEHYHDHEWGFPIADDRHLFEALSLEAFQSGLSWRTILDKRENFRRAFARFEVDAVAAFGPADVERLLQDAGICRHRGKIEAVVHNAGVVQRQAVAGESLAALIWQHAPEADAPAHDPAAPVPAAAVTLSKALKRRGWKFVGPTTVHAFMQAAGLVNDHAEGCVARAAAARARKVFKVPVQHT